MLVAMARARDNKRGVWRASVVVLGVGYFRRDQGFECNLLNVWLQPPFFAYVGAESLRCALGDGALYRLNYKGS